jgi:outer membrane protein OmpA-like peptidoglycan-associated protein
MRYALILVFLTLGSRLVSQLDFGEFNTPYAGVHGLSFNPAEIVDSRYKFHMNLIGLGLRASNNFVGLSSDMISLSPPNLNDSTKKIYLPRDSNGSDKHAYLQADIMGPSFMFSLGRKNKFSIGISTNVKTLVTVNNVSERLANYMFDNKDTNNWKESTSKDFMFNGSLWANIGLTLGTVIFDKPGFSLKGAITPKMNIGMVSTYAYSPNLKLEFASQNSIKNANGMLDNQISAPFVVNSQFKGDSLKLFENMGFGADIGIIFEKKNKKEYTYEMDCRTDNVRRDLNKYSYRIGLSLIDYGYIQWKGKAPFRRVAVDENAMTTDIANSKFSKFPDVQRHTDSLLALSFNGVSLDTSRADYFMWTPTKLNAFIDINIYKSIYLAANGTYGFVINNYAASKTQNMQFAVTPRVENKLFGLYLPINYNMLAQEVNAGIGFRLLFFNFALYDWTGIAGLKPQTKNAAFNMSINIPFHQKAMPKDNDGDLMSNKKDKCPNDAGDCNGDGCPEADDDADGIGNSIDKCPNQKGVKAFDGCPDTDQDEIPDHLDRCPKKKGLKELGGCPDKDGDGLPDHEDKCPNEKGPKKFDGCPDTDLDGVPDNADECPSIPGIYDNKGCPPVIPPKDTDNDGLIDSLDKCPFEVGPKANKGCPITAEAISIVKVAQEKLEFETGSSVIKKESHQSLNTLAYYLVKNSDFKVSLKGHTDNVGAAEKNLKLSIDRANAVKAFFIDRGVDASRIEAQGFGMQYPVTDNRTPAGRAANRRVDIEIK